MRKQPGELRCFVISPIGEAGSENRRKADAVLKFVCEAAATINEGAPRKLVPYRGDESRLTGDILRDIVSSILEDELIVGVLFNDNPNVYLELGIAETLGRPVILLKDQGYTAPFDMKMFRSISYSADLYETGADPVAMTALVARFRDFVEDIAIAPPCKVPFDIDKISPPARTYPLDRFSYMNYRDWSEMILHAEKEIWLAGTSLWELFQPKKDSFFEPLTDARGEPTGEVRECRLIDLLRAMFLRGRTINIVTMHEDSPHLAAMMGASDEAAQAGMLDEARDEIRKTHRCLDQEMARLKDPVPASLLRPGGIFRVTKVRNRSLTHRVTMTERIGYVTPIFYTRTDINTGPSFRVTPKSNFETQQRGGHKFDQMSLYAEVLNDLRLHFRENETREVRAPAP